MSKSKKFWSKFILFPHVKLLKSNNSFKLFNFISPIIGGDRLCDGRGNSEAESWEPSQAKFKYKNVGGSKIY